MFSNPIASDKKESKRWSKSIEKDGISKSINVEEIENGFIICTSEYGSKAGKYYDYSKKYYSESNPLSDGNLVKENKAIDAISEFLKEL